MPTDPRWWVPLLVIVPIGLVWLSHRRQQVASSPVAAHLQRLLLPRAPDDCPAWCQHAAPTASPTSRPPLIPWSVVKSRRGASKPSGTQPFACPRRRCAHCRIPDEQIHALLGDGTHGRCERIVTLGCQACGIAFSIRRDTHSSGSKPRPSALAEC